MITAYYWRLVCLDCGKVVAKTNKKMVYGTIPTENDFINVNAKELVTGKEIYCKCGSKLLRQQKSFSGRNWHNINLIVVG